MLNVLNLVFVFVVCVIARYAYNRWYRNRSILAPPIFPGSLPLIGHAPMVIGDCVHIWQFIKRVSDYCLQNKGIVTVNLAVMDLHVITDPDIFVTVSNNFLDKAYVYDFAKHWLGDGMIVTSGAIAKRSHKLLGPAFNSQVLNHYLEVFNSQSRVLTESFAKELYTGPFDHTIHFARLTVESVCLTSMGLDIEECGIKKDVYLRIVQDIQKTMMTRFARVWLHPSFMFNFSNLKKEHVRLVKLSNDMILKLIRTKRSNRMKNNSSNNNGTPGSKFRSFIDILLEISDDSHALSDKQIKDEVEAMMLAGHETLSYALVAVLVILGSYPDVQQKAYEECKAVLGDTDRDVEKDDLLKLVYLEAVLMEVLRLYPVGPIIGRYIDSDVKLGDFTIKAGTSCILSVYGIQRHPMWGPDVDQFRPARWLDKASLPQHPAAFSAFSRGKRSCIGKTYATMLMKTAVAHILRRYRVTADHAQLVLKFNVALQPESGHFITIHRRDK